MRIIPAIDIIDGKCVRLTKGDYATRKIYNEDPLEEAKRFEDHGIKYLHLVDLDGAKSQHIVNYKILERIATKTHLQIDFGGGLKSDEDLKIAFDSGAHQITGGSIAVKNPLQFENWLKRFGSEKIILGADALNEQVAISGWQETTGPALLPFIADYLQKGVEYVICTDISKDGLLQGSSVDLYKKILDGFSGSQIKLIASGGVTNLSDLEQLQQIGCEGAIIGKALYEGTLSLQDLKGF